MADCPQHPKPFRPWQRILYAAVGGGLIALLAVAAWLEPVERGFGTHRALGLPECSFLSLTGRRCPSCGMTTSWAYWMRGRVLRAVSVNAGGSLLALAATICGPWLLISGLRGRYVWFRLNEYVLIGWAVATVVVVLVQWGWRMLF